MHSTESFGLLIILITIITQCFLSRQLKSMVGILLSIVEVFAHSHKFRPIVIVARQRLTNASKADNQTFENCCPILQLFFFYCCSDIFWLYVWCVLLLCLSSIQIITIIMWNRDYLARLDLSSCRRRHYWIMPITIDLRAIRWNLSNYRPIHRNGLTINGLYVCSIHFPCIWASNQIK